MKKHLFLPALLLITNVLTAQVGFTSYLNTITVGHTRTCLKIDPAGNKWMGTTSKGAYLFDGTNWSVYNTSTSGIAGLVVNDIAFDSSNNKWFATRSGISKFDGSTWITYNISNSGLPSDSTYCIYAGTSEVWIGTKQGLAKFDGSSWTVYNTSNSGLINNYVTAVNIDANGNVWVGTQTGLCVKTSSGWITYNETNSNFTADQVTAIYFENLTTTWIGTKNTSLYKFKNGIVTPLTSIGMEYSFSSPTNITSICKGPQGGVIFGCTGSNSFFYEITDSQVYVYYNTSGYISNFVSFDPAANIVWFLKSTVSGTNNAIYSFDYSLSTVPYNIYKYPMLDVNQVRAVILNRGDMHWNLSEGGYEVPKNSGRKAVFASSLWIGGLDNGGALHQAAMTYRQTGNDYWPGPLDTLSGNIDSSTSLSYDKVWKLDRWQIDEFRTMFANGSVTAGTYTPAYDIINWPANGWSSYSSNLAPYVDVNGDGVYDYLSGDYPKIKGDQMCYWIFNDNLAAHGETGGAPLKVEVHASAYAYNCDSLADSLKALNYTTFYDYEIYNRSGTNYHDVHIGYWQDPDLGSYNDDYVGCNPSENYSFTYNADSYDENVGGILGYGSNPPMYGNVILNGPVAQPGDGIDNNNNGAVDEPGEKNLMTHVVNYNNNSSPVNGNPANAVNFYDYMTGKWKDGTNVTYGGTGIGGATPTSFMFSGPLDGTPWSEISEANVVVDRRIVMSCGPFNLNAAQHVNFNFAIVYTRDNNPSYNIVSLYNKNLADVRRIKQWFATDAFPSCDPSVSTAISAPNANADELTVFPNPASSVLFVNYQSDSKNNTIEIYDVRGQLIKTEKMNSLSKQSINISNLSKGLYLLKVSDGKSVQSERFIKQ
jgi:hypothetical protein